MVATVLGEVAPEQLGFTLPHEHIIHRVSLQSGNPDNTCVDPQLVAAELAIFRQAGGGSVCDVTPLGIGRDPQALKEVSRLSGVPIISALGLYQLDVWPEQLRNMSRRELAAYLVAEAGGESTGVQAGFLGEITSHNESHSDWRRYRL